MAIDYEMKLKIYYISMFYIYIVGYVYLVNLKMSCSTAKLVRAQVS